MLHLARCGLHLTTNNGDGTFTDVTAKSGLADEGQWSSSAAWIDYDNDGWPDIVQANGAMLDNISLYHSEETYPQLKLMFRNLGHGKFEKVSKYLGPDFMRPVVGRGFATADLDNDVDLAINVRGDFPQLLRNDGGNANHWLNIKLVGTKCNRNGLGAVLGLNSEGFIQVQQAKGGRNYTSASDPRIHFGLGKWKKIEPLEITWPSGELDKLGEVPINQCSTIKEGAGIVPGKSSYIPGK